MKTIQQILDERKKLLNWIITTESKVMREAFVQQIKMLDWVLE